MKQTRSSKEPIIAILTEHEPGIFTGPRRASTRAG